jgi:hypothetical protein
LPALWEGRRVAAMTEFKITTSKTWQPTGLLRRVVAQSLSGAIANNEHLEQEWGCLETHEREWRPVPIIIVDAL